MDDQLSNIPLSLLFASLFPVFIVLFVQYKWSLNYKEGLYAVTRMLGQLLLIGYVLGFIFNTDSSGVILLTLSIMLSASAWIALRTIPTQRGELYFTAIICIAIGGGVILVLITQIVLNLDPWYQPRYMIPLAGMIFAYSMNAISLSSERYFDELSRGQGREPARTAAYRAGLIPMTNSFFSVGLVLIPGMMTGQILSGTDPLIAARYQIMVMAMVFGSGGLSSALFLYSIGRRQTPTNLN